MAWTAPHTWVFEETPTYTQFNTEFRDNLTYLKDLFDISTGHDHAGGTDDGAPVAPGGLAASAVSASNVAGCAITNPAVGDDAIDDRTAGSRIIQLYRRQGNHSTNWDVTGTTPYIPDTIRMQVGALQLSASTTDSGSFVVTFPVEFSDSPLVLFSLHTTSPSIRAVQLGTYSGCATFGWDSTGGSVSQQLIYCHWMAIGPE